MALGKAEWRKRVAAACALHGIDLSELPRFEGLPQDAARRAGHPSDDYLPNHSLALALADELGLPVDWFEAEDWRPLIRSSAQAAAESPATRLDLAALKAELLADLAAQALAARDAQHQQPEPGDSAEGLTGG